LPGQTMGSDCLFNQRPSSRGSSRTEIHGWSFLCESIRLRRVRVGGHPVGTVELHGSCCTFNLGGHHSLDFIRWPAFFASNNGSHRVVKDSPAWNTGVTICRFWAGANFLAASALRRTAVHIVMMGAWRRLPSKSDNVV